MEYVVKAVESSAESSRTHEYFFVDVGFTLIFIAILFRFIFLTDLSPMIILFE